MSLYVFVLSVKLFGLMCFEGSLAARHVLSGVLMFLFGLYAL